MLWLLKLLVFGHVHAWETVKTVRLTNDGGEVGQRLSLRCLKCGHVKKVDFI